MRVSRRWKVATGVLGAAGIALTPTYWLLGGPDAGQLVAASVQGATGILALAWAVMAPSAAAPVSEDSAANTGKAQATAGGTAVTGVRRSAVSSGGSAAAQRTGDATAHGPGSTAATGIDYS